MSAAGQWFMAVIVPPVNLEAFIHSGEFADRLCR